MTETTTILEINSKDLVTYLSNSLDYVNTKSIGILNSIYISEAFIAASEGSKLILTQLGPTDSTSNNYVLLDSKDVAVFNTTLKALNKLDKKGFKVLLSKVENTVAFKVFDCFKEVKLTYNAIDSLKAFSYTDIKAPNYSQCLIEDKKVLGIFKKSSLLKSLNAFRDKNAIVTINRNFPDTIDFDESTKEVNFYVKDLLTLLKTSTQEGILLYTHEEGERVLKSPVFIEQDNITAMIMPVIKNND